LDDRSYFEACFLEDFNALNCSAFHLPMIVISFSATIAGEPAPLIHKGFRSWRILFEGKMLLVRGGV
jgi:hypothetical protein